MKVSDLKKKDRPQGTIIKRNFRQKERKQEKKIYTPRKKQNFSFTRNKIIQVYCKYFAVIFKKMVNNKIQFGVRQIIIQGRFGHNWAKNGKLSKILMKRFFKRWKLLSVQINKRGVTNGIKAEKNKRSKN